jgi:hypothetical protein
MWIFRLHLIENAWLGLRDIVQILSHICIQLFLKQMPGYRNGFQDNWQHITSISNLWESLNASLFISFHSKIWKIFIRYFKLFCINMFTVIKIYNFKKCLVFKNMLSVFFKELEFSMWNYHILYHSAAWKSSFIW